MLGCWRLARQEEEQGVGQSGFRMDLDFDLDPFELAAGHAPLKRADVAQAAQH